MGGTAANLANGVSVSVQGTLANGVLNAATIQFLAGNPGPTTVTLTGDHLTGATSVTFDGVAATDLVVVDDQTVTLTTPAHVEGPVDVAVTTAVGSATLVGGFTYLP